MGRSAERPKLSRHGPSPQVLERVRSDQMVNQRSEGKIEERVHDDASVDLTQIDMMLSMTPRQRLETLYHTASSLARLMPDVEAD